MLTLCLPVICSAEGGAPGTPEETLVPPSASSFCSALWVSLDHGLYHLLLLLQREVSPLPAVCTRRLCSRLSLEWKLPSTDTNTGSCFLCATLYSPCGCLMTKLIHRCDVFEKLRLFYFKHGGVYSLLSLVHRPVLSTK